MLLVVVIVVVADVVRLMPLSDNADESLAQCYSVLVSTLRIRNFI